MTFVENIYHYYHVKCFDDEKKGKKRGWGLKSKYKYTIKILFQLCDKKLIDINSESYLMFLFC